MAAFLSVLYLQVLSGVAAGLAYLHDKGIVHGNLRPSKVLFSSNGAVKITVDVCLCVSVHSCAQTISLDCSPYKHTRQDQEAGAEPRGCGARRRQRRGVRLLVSDGIYLHSHRTSVCRGVSLAS